METPAVRPGAATRAAQWLALILLLLLGLAIVAAMAEGTARARQWLKYGTATSYADMYGIDDAIPLRTLKPGFRSANIAINSVGFRGPEILQPKPSQVIRLAFLGASTTFCAEVSADAAVWPQLVTERFRRDFPNTAFDFVNGGVPGYSVDSSRLNLQHRVQQLKPDLIVVYHATNDFSAEVRAQAVAQGIADAAADASQGWLERHSLLWELVLKNLRVRQAQQAATTASSTHLKVRTETLGAGFGRDLTGLLQDANKTGARVAVATFATQLRDTQTPEQQSRAAVSAFVYMPFMSLSGLLAGYRRYNDIISTVARAQGALLIGGENNIPGDPTHFVDTVHFTDAGSRAMAERVYGALSKDPTLLSMIAARSK